jgi:hypothetical protein
MPDFTKSPVALAMLVMVTNYEPISAVLAACARQFLNRHGAGVLAVAAPDWADWHHPDDWLRTYPGAALVFFGHGADEPPMFVSQVQRGFIDAGKIELLRGRFIYAVCCHAVNGVGKYVAGVGATLVGYRGKLGVPLREAYATKLAHCILAGLEKVRDNEPAEVVRNAACDAYWTTARNLYEGTALDCLMAPIFEGNGEAVAIQGNGKRRPRP